MTMQRTAAVLALTTVWTATGCRRESKPAPPATPTTRVVAPTTTAALPPTTRPAAPVPATFVINGQEFEFPPAKLVVQTRDDRLHVTLFSDDPPEALKDGYTGNSFYFAFDLDADATDDLPGQGYVFRNSAAAEHDDTTNGLFIAGGRQTLRPLEARVGFDSEEGQTVAYVSGTFRLIDQQDPDATSPPAKLRGRLEPRRVEAKR